MRGGDQWAVSSAMDCAMWIRRMLYLLTATTVLHQNSPHSFRCFRTKVTAAVSLLSAIQIDHSDKRFMDQ